MTDIRSFIAFHASRPVLGLFLALGLVVTMGFAQDLSLLRIPSTSWSNINPMISRLLLDSISIQTLGHT